MTVARPHSPARPQPEDGAVSREAATADGTDRKAAAFSELVVRLARLEDSEAIRTIYNVEVETSTVTMDLRARTADEQRHWLMARNGAHAVVVAALTPQATGQHDSGRGGGAQGDGERIAGFASLSPWRNRPGYSTTVEDSVYVDRSCQGLGVGRRLLEQLLEVARAHGFHAMMARVASGHQASLALHMGLGFELVGTERQVARKFGRWIDIDVLQLLL